MSQAIPIDQAPTAKELLALLKSDSATSLEQNTLLMISLGMVATDEAEAAFWDELSDTLNAFKKRQNAKIYALSRTDSAALVRMTEYNQVSMLTDAKVELLRLIQQYFPDQFGMVDQSRLLRTLDLRFKKQNAIRFLERFVEEETKAKSQPSKRKRLRRLAESDIDRVVEVTANIGSGAFAKVFVRWQKITEILPGAPPIEIMQEYFVGMDALKTHVFSDVELRGSGNLFNQLTITLDRLLLGAYRDANPKNMQCSINLNVESVFTRTFEEFLSKTGESALENIAFEFRQANVLQQFDEYEVATNLIKSRGGTVAIDAVFPETVGIVNMQRLRADYAKIFWRQGAEQLLPTFEKDLEEMQDRGTQIIFARVDDEQAVEVGHDLGVNMFQGFYIDDLL